MKILQSVIEFLRKMSGTFLRQFMSELPKREELDKPISTEEIEFLQQSNYIEGVTDSDSLDQAVLAWEYLKTQKELNITNIKKTHKILMANQSLLPNEKGYFRTIPVWISGRTGAAVSGVPAEMMAWAVAANLPKNDLAIQQDHIIYEKIHPFVDGNGRTGRMFMNWQRLNSGLPILIIREEDRQDYYNWFK
jgi:hypothetical protein